MLSAIDEFSTKESVGFIMFLWPTNATCLSHNENENILFVPDIDVFDNVVKENLEKF